MPIRRRRFTKRRAIRRRARRNPRVTRSLMFNKSPVFTEAFVYGQVQPNTGGVFKFNIGSVPQLAQYTSLYQKYRILKAQLILLPQYYGQDENAAEYNAGNNVFAAGLGRMVYAIDDSPAVVGPANEAQVLQHNGVKIKQVKTALKMACRPVANTNDANGVQMTFKRKYINFVQTNVDHFGITFWYSQPTVGATPSVNNTLNIYCKLTFQLSDPR